MKLLIAEDEITTREGLLQCVPPVFTQVYAVGNGQAAFQAAMEMKPDVVLCDIRMPKMNGIELAQRLRQCFPDIHIIFISGYSDKEYLKAAITLRADGYIDKPIDEAELQRFLNRAAEQIQSRQRAEIHQKHMMKRASDYARQLLLQSILRRPEQLADALHMNETLASTLTQAGRYLTLCIHLGWDDTTATQLSDTPDQQLAERIQQQLPAASLCSAQASTYIGAVIWGNDAVPQTICRQMEEILSAALSNQMHLSRVQACISPVCGELKQLCGLYKTARAHTQWLHFISESNMVCELLPTAHPLVLQDQTALLTQLLRKHDLVQARQLIQGQTAAIIRCGSGSITQVRKYYEKLLLAYIYVQAEYSPADKMDSMELLSAFQHLTTLPEMTRFLLLHIDDLLPPIPIPDTASDKLRQIMEYIRRNLSDSSLSVQSIAACMGLTENYLSTLYKRETGNTLHKDIIELRLSRAKYLLARGFNLSTVAQKSGFSSAGYFHSVFKKHTGLNPAEYARRCQAHDARRKDDLT